MQDEDGDESPPQDEEKETLGVYLTLVVSEHVHIGYLPVTCGKRPPEDYEPHTDSTVGEGHQGDKSQSVPQPNRRKRSKQAKPPPRASKMGHRRRHSKLTLSEFEEGVTGECTIEILQEDKLQIVNRKQKFVKQSSLRFGPFDFSEDTAWEEFLDKVAEACEVTHEGMVISSLCWKWMKPANSSPVPLCNVAGFKSLKKKLTGHQPMIILMMRPPKAPDSEKPVCSLLFASTCSANVFGTSDLGN